MNSPADHIIFLASKNPPQTDGEFFNLCRSAGSSLGASSLPNKTELLKAYHALRKEGKVEPIPFLEKILVRRAVRSLSGVAIVTSLIKPYTCPGKCVYCPTEVRMPKSYIATEPAAARALRLDFSPYLQMKMRLEALTGNGHPTEKIEFIVKGGTWNAYPIKYQYWFILETFRAANNLSRRSPTLELKKYDDLSLEELQKLLRIEQDYNETAEHRIIGVTLETRPDAISPKTIWYMRNQGCTRIELGLQAPDDKILELIKRGHTVEQFRRAMVLLRAAGFKTDLHFMPDLPGTTPAHDVEMYQTIFTDPGLKPDMVKIYPCTVVKSAELYGWFQNGTYKPYGEKNLFEALLAMKKSTPRYCRISRLIRDIPATEIEAGNIITNLREALGRELNRRGDSCLCLRCREIGHQPIEVQKKVAQEKPELFMETYDTIGGTEYFLSFEDANRLAVFAFLRLRLPDREPPKDAEKKVAEIHALFPALRNTAFVRELHTYGQLVNIGDQEKSASQHKGLGKKLLLAAEKIAREHGYQNIAVISGIGVRDYYRHQGYRLQDTYMLKALN